MNQITAEWLDASLEKPGRSAAALSRFTGIEASKISKMRTGNRKITAVEAVQIMKYFASGTTSEVSIPDADEYRMISAYDIKASAGSGASHGDLHTNEPMYSLAFRHQWLDAITSAQDEMLAVLFAFGDSMEGTLRDGDTMLVDRSQTNLRRPGVFVIGFDGVLNVKRISVNEIAGTIRISSDNPTYADYDANPDDDRFQVYGRVIWIGRKI